MRRITKPGKIAKVWALTSHQPIRVCTISNHQWLAVCVDGQTYEVDARANTARVSTSLILTADGYITMLPPDKETRQLSQEIQQKLDALAWGIRNLHTVAST